MAYYMGIKLVAHALRQYRPCPAAQCGKQRLKEQQKYRTQGQDIEQIEIAIDQNMVHDQLGVVGRQQRDDF